MSGVKEYKLKKDIITPVETIPAGTVFNFYNGTADADGYEYLVVEEIVEDFDEWFEEISKPPKLWRATVGGEYFTLGYGGKVITRVDLYDNADDYNFNTGNYFKTEDEADDYRNYLLAKRTLIYSTKGFIPRTTGPLYTVSMADGELYVVRTPYRPGGIFFRSKEAAEESMEKYKDNWEYVIRYETEHREYKRSKHWTVKK